MGGQYSKAAHIHNQGHFMTKEIVHAYLITETNKLEKVKLDADIGYASSQDREGWLINRAQQARDLNTGQYMQLISESDCRPIKVFRNANGAQPINVALVNREAQADARTTVDEDQNNHDSRLLTIGIVLGVLLLVFLIVIWKAIG